MIGTPTHDDDDAHVAPPVEGAGIFHVPLSAIDIEARARWNGTVSVAASRYATRRNETVPIDGASLSRLGREWAEAADEIRRLRKALAND